MADSTAPPTPRDPSHRYAQTKHISFEFYKQRKSPASFGYEYFVSLPPSYESSEQSYPLILSLHGAAESQRNANESYASIRHGIPKMILCYDQMKQGVFPPHIDIPQALRLRRSKSGQNPATRDLSSEPVSRQVCSLVAENFITVTPSLDMGNGYGWNSSVLSALLDEITQTYRIDLDRIHLTGFSMGGYGAWALGISTPSRFATLTPICGGGDPILAKHITHIPHWIHHGDLDDIIPVSQSLAMEEALVANDAVEVNFSRYPKAKHDCWSYAYNDVEVYTWMLGHTRGSSGDEVVVPEDNKVVVDGEVEMTGVEEDLKMVGGKGKEVRFAVGADDKPLMQRGDSVAGLMQYEHQLD